MAVWRLSSELDFFKPRVGPSSTGVDGAGGGRERHRNTDKCKRYVSARNECVTAIKNTATIKKQPDKHV